ncbi:insulin-like growth factor-binding protein complex acid labile subunit [Liolophura sinensis]|uniref:insulin-like growth factor-binding protein complex acid labile subunit n=1 Tax=Liolophura sinensis TaxID=3198878 RepID=UPI0031593E3A
MSPLIPAPTMTSLTMFCCVAGLGLWMAVTSYSASAQVTDLCPTGCRCGPVENPFTYETVFTIGCSNLTLTEVMEFRGGEKVDVLDLSGHRISVLKNGAFKGIKPKKILLQNNNISVIEPEAFTDVALVAEKLDLSTNNLFHLPQGLENMSALKTLKLAGNRKLKLVKGSFRGLMSLETLDLDQCFLSEIPDGTFGDVGGTLRKLHLSGNKLTIIPVSLQQLRKVEEIDLDNNPITSISAHAFRGMEKLKKLTLNRNEFSKPDSLHPLAFVDVALTLEDLDFYHSRMTVCPTEALSPLRKLRTLGFDANEIKAFPPKAFQTLDSLTKLVLDGNKFNFTEDMFVGITDTLTKLSIRGMGLTQLPVRELAALDHLQWLDASANNFKTLPDNFTRGIHANRYTLEHMKVTDISAKAFSGKDRTVHLDLEDNKIKRLDFVADPCMFEYVAVSENPLFCDCHSLHVASHSHIILSGMCKGPPPFANMDVSGVPFKKLAQKKCANNAKTMEIVCPAIKSHSKSTGISVKHSLTLLMTSLMTLLALTFYM